MIRPALRTVDGERVSDLAAESNHRIANHLAILAGMVRMHGTAITCGPGTLSSFEVRNLLNEISGKIISVGHLHRMLADQNRDEHIDLGKYLSESCSVLVSSLGLAGRASFAHEFDEACHVTAEQAQSMALIANEIFMNAIKYAHPTGIPVQMRFACKRAKDGQLHVEIADDGIGLPEGFNPEIDGGVGFTLIRSLASSLGAKLMIASDCLGTSFLFVFRGSKCAPKLGEYEIGAPPPVISDGIGAH